MTHQDDSALPADDIRPKQLARRITIGLCLGIACGIFFGEYCQPLQTIGDAYVGLLQMTVLPYLVLSLTGKLGRLNIAQARKLSLAGLAVLIAFGLIAIVLIVLVSSIFPAAEGASFYSPRFEQTASQADDFITTFVPTNIFFL